MLFYSDAMTSTTSNIAFGNASSSVQGNINSSFHIEPDNILDHLPRAEDAPFNSYAKQHEPACLPNTRVDLLQEIYSWADGQDERCIFWLSGLVGTGKSTIARTVAERYYANQRLAASFFFSHGGGDTGHAGMFVTSLALQLAHNVPALRQHISDAIVERGDIARHSLRDQWHHLVLRPLSKLHGLEAGQRRYIIVVDALDECDNDSNVRIIVQLLAEVRSSLTGARLRVLLTSRPEVPIRHGFKTIADSEHKDAILHNISASIINHDIGLFFQHHLRIIAEECNQADDWPDVETIGQLVQSACGLFIWAATACRFIQGGGRFAADRLRAVLKDSSSIDSSSANNSSSSDSGTDEYFEILPEQRLDSIYHTVLRNLVRRYRKQERKRWYTLIRETLGAIVLLQSPLSTSSLAQLLRVPTEDVHRTLYELHSIIDVPQDLNWPVRLHHPSFRDFLLNRKRCKDDGFWVEETGTHKRLASRCLELMCTPGGLRQDMCNLSDPGVLRRDIDEETVNRNLPPELQYACRYWVDHLERSRCSIEDGDATHHFLEKHLLHWLEAISLLNETSLCVRLLARLQALAKPSDSTVAKFVHDAVRFVLRFIPILAKAPLQIYSSALLFSPESSVVRKAFIKQVPQAIRVISGGDVEWDAYRSVLEGHSDQVSAVAFSPDGRSVASASADSIQLDTTRRQQNEVEDTVHVLGVERTTRERLQVNSHTARPRLSEKTIQEHPRQLGLQSLQTEGSKLWSELDKDSTYAGTTFDGNESMFLGQTLIHSSVSETGNEKPSGILFPEHTINEGDIRSIISDEDDDRSQISMSNAGRSREIENSIVSLLATNSILTPVYKDALELMPKERFANNFERVLRAFRVDLRRLDGTLITQELSAVLLSKEVRKRITRKITDRFVSDQNSLSEQDLRRVHGPDETNFSYLEAWLTKTNVHPSLLNDAPGQPEATIVVQPDYEEDGSDMSNSEEEGKEYSRNMDVARFPRLDLVMQNLIEGQPFQDMVTRLKEFLLPAGLLRDILPVPRENITYESNGSHGLLSTIQARLEDLTELEWDWWPLPPRMGPLNEGDTRVFWRCLCGTVRWRTLKSAQKHILEGILKEPPRASQRPLFCVQTNPPLRPALALGNQPQSDSLPLSRSSASAAVPSLPTNSDPISRFSDSTASSQISRGTSPTPGHTASTQNGYQQKKPLWFIFKIEGSRSSLDWDHFGDEGLTTDRLFQQKLKQRHNELRGWFRLWFSYWRLSYWEFVKLQRTRPGRLVDRGVDLPKTLDYEYSPRPPTITAEDPWISRHEFEEIVKSCITPCWLSHLPTFLGFHDCACPNADAKRLISALPKRNTKFMISSSSDGEDYVWGIHARYVVSGLYVFWIHMAILAITLGLWIWWQTKHPDDLQGASVPLTVAGICISTFWASTGILKGLR